MQFQLKERLDGKYYCRIYQLGIPGAIAMKDDYETKEEAIKAAEVLISKKRATNEEK